MQVTVGNQLRIENPSEQLLTWCKKQLILPNPEYAKKVRMHFWVGNIPEKLYLFQWDGDTLVLPYGCLNDVLAMGDCHTQVLHRPRWISVAPFRSMTTKWKPRKP